MARTFISQPTQVFRTEHYDDTLSAGSTLQSSATSVEYDLNAIRSQIRRLLWAGVSGSWYDAITAPSGTISARGLNTINTDLTDLEQKRFLYRKHNLNLVNVATGSNFALLSTSLGTAPNNYAVVYHPLLSVTAASGTIVALLSGSEGAYGSHSVAQASGSSVLVPKNLVLVRDAWTGLPLTASVGRDVYGLLQAESGTLTGDAFNDSSRRTQISFVYETVFNGTSSLAAASTALVGGRTVQYSYVTRTSFDDLPEDACLNTTVFVDMPEGSGGSGGSVTLSDITLNNAIDNQVGAATMAQNITVQMAAGTTWSFTSGSTPLWSLTSSDSTDTLVAAVDRFSVSSSNPSTFQSGISVSTGSTSIGIGVIAGAIHTLAGNSLLLSGGLQLQFADSYGAASTYSGGIMPFATATIEWNEFVTNFGSRSVISTLNYLSQSISGTIKRHRYTAGVSANLNPDINITFPTNLDAQLGSYVGRSFINDVDVYLNGVLLLPGITGSNPNDVYPGTSPSTGDLKFPYAISSGSIITMVVHG